MGPKRITNAELTDCVDYCYSNPCSTAVLENILFYVSGNKNTITKYIASHTEFSSKEIKEAIEELKNRNMIEFTNEGDQEKELCFLTTLGERTINYYMEDVIHLYDNVITESDVY